MSRPRIRSQDGVIAHLEVSVGSDQDVALAATAEAPAKLLHGGSTTRKMDRRTRPAEARLLAQGAMPSMTASAWARRRSISHDPRRGAQCLRRWTHRQEADQAIHGDREVREDPRRPPARPGSPACRSAPSPLQQRGAFAMIEEHLEVRIVFPFPRGVNYRPRRDYSTPADCHALPGIHCAAYFFFASRDSVASSSSIRRWPPGVPQNSPCRAELLGRHSGLRARMTPLPMTT